MARHVVILAGGAGTRLWPWSRRRTPKHLLAVRGDQSLLQASVRRVRELASDVYIVTERSQAQSILAQVPELPADHLVIEPGRRGTASALSLAALVIAARDPGATMISVHADHDLGNDDTAYLNVLDAEARWAETQQTLVTVGLRPPYPATGFGYIELGEPVDGPVKPPAFRVKAFKEKPDPRTAKEYVERGGFLWHLGLFSWPVEVFLAEIQEHTPEIAAGLHPLRRALVRRDAAEAESAYLALPTQAIDTAVLERTHNLLAVRADFEWHDVGTWAELWETLEKDEAGNAVTGNHVLIDSRNNLIHSPGKLVAAIGLDDMVVIETQDALLISPKERSQEVRRIVERLSQEGKAEYL